MEVLGMLELKKGLCQYVTCTLRGRVQGWNPNCLQPYLIFSTKFCLSGAVLVTGVAGVVGHVQGRMKDIAGPGQGTAGPTAGVGGLALVLAPLKGVIQGPSPGT
jgi:hypothetical protein